MQYLYLIQCQQFYKIGIANDVQSRLAQLSTGNPFELVLLAAYGFDNGEPVERALHQRFANNRKRGEWFQLFSKDIETFHQICQLLEGRTVPVVPTVEEYDIEETEVLAEPTDGGKWDYAAMFADGWRMELANDGTRNRYWVWRKGGKSVGRRYIYGGTIASLPYPIEEVRRRYHIEEQGDT